MTDNYLDEISFKKDIFFKMQKVTNYDVLFDFIMIHNVPFTKNNNGIFINLSLLDMDILIKINDILTIDGQLEVKEEQSIDKELNFYKDSLKPHNEGKLELDGGLDEEYMKCTLTSIQKSILQLSY